jgi:hypothetical protein
MISGPNQSYFVVSLLSAAWRVCKSRDGKHRLFPALWRTNGLEAVVPYDAVSLSGQQPPKRCGEIVRIDAREAWSVGARVDRDFCKISASVFRVATTLAVFRRIPVWVGRDRRQVVSFGLQLLLDLLDCPIELLVFAFEFLSGVVLDDDVGIDAATFNDPLFAVL